MTGDQNGRGRYGIGQRFARLLARRPALFRFVVAIVLARIIFSVLDLVESRVVGYSLIITAALAAEVVVIWRRVAPHRGRVLEPRTGAEGSSLERFLAWTERYGAMTVSVITAAALVAELVLALRGVSRTTLLDITGAVRWVELIVLLIVLWVAHSWDRRFPESVGSPQSQSRSQYQSAPPLSPSHVPPSAAPPPPAPPPPGLAGGTDPSRG